MSDNIKVVVKVRPLITREIEEKLSYQWRVKNNTLYQLDCNGRDVGQNFTFDQVYDKDTKTSEVYNDIAKPIVEAAIAGINGTIFAYGQTSSGKTYTMSGTEGSPGIIPLAVLNLFETIKKIPDRDFLVRVSYVEIYNETLKDLLDVERKKIKVQDTINGIKVDVTERVTSSPEEVLEAMKEGEANRQIGATNMNEESSRSHSIFQITIESREHIEGEEEVGCVNVSQLNLVDLAGSERAGQTGATGIRFKEGTHINKSLSALALVIKQLSEDPKKHISYRDSKLTRILQNSLGGNAKTSIICAITPAAVDETISTLQFANRAKAIKNKPEVNAVATNATMIQSLTKQLSKLQSELQSKKNLEKDNYKLMKQIEKLQKLILNGFGHRSSGESMNANRRKTWCAPRRMTISTLHPIEENPLPPVPKFCTPIMKYNPMCVSEAMDFVPIQNASKLMNVTEEPNTGYVTPQPTDKKVNFNDEIIEIDSDDDNSSDVQTCSPYHKCYGTKTPPCVLRKNAIQAEKSLKDIVELTEREKIYSPSVVELMEKLEQNTNVIAKLEDNVVTLNKICKDKDSEIDELRNKINKAEEEIKAVLSAKMDLEVQCENYNTKLTDTEVIYETLKKKSKVREEELLLLLEEQKGKDQKLNDGDSGKTLSRIINKDMLHFMDMSKDISSVNSDNESTVSPNDESSAQVQELVTDIQTQLTIKTQTILDLEADLLAQKQKITSLENTNQGLQETVNSFIEKLSNVENENSFLKSTIQTLNSTINSQSENLQAAHNEMESYNNIILELQTKLTEKQNKVNFSVNDSMLETMIMNEEKLIANNDNFNNIVQSFKLALENRNKEIDNLKSTLEEVNRQPTDIDNKFLKEHIEMKEKEINTLTAELQNLKQQLNENVALVNKLIEEKNNLISAERTITEELADIQKQNNDLLKQNGEYLSHVKSLEEYNAEKEFITKEISSRNEDLLQQVKVISQKMVDLQSEINTKDNIIRTFNNHELETQEYLSKAKSALTKLQEVVSILTGDIREVPEVIDNMIVVFNILDDNLNTLEDIATDLISQKLLSAKECDKLKIDMSSMLEKHQSEIKELHTLVQTLRENDDEAHNLRKDIEKLRNELNKKSEVCTTMATELHDVKKINENMRSDILCKETLISSLKEKESELHKEIQILIQEREQNYGNFKDEIQNLHATLQMKEETFDEIIRDKNNNISELDRNLKIVQNALEDKCTELENHIQKENDALKNGKHLMENILQKVSEMTCVFDIKNSLSCNFNDSDINIYEQILLTLDKIGNHITLLNSNKIDNNVDHNDFEQILSEAKTEIRELTQRNLKLMDDLAHAVGRNQELSIELETIQINNKSLWNSLIESNNLLEQLQKDLKSKSNEIENMEVKARQCKEQLKNHNSLIKYVQELQTENSELATDTNQCLEFLNEDAENKNILNGPENCDTNGSENNVTRKSPQSLLTICCNKIIESINPKEDDTKSVTSSSNTSINITNTETQVNLCQCNELLSKLLIVQEENTELKNCVQQLNAANKNLCTEQEEVRQEIKLLLQPAMDLQKKITNHRTNLSTLTATTYTENKLLESRLKVLQHHYDRFDNLCRRDIPAVRQQLCQLMTILKNDVTFNDKENTSFKRYSLPDALDKYSTLSNFKNESTLDGDFLMLDTNVTLTTLADNTLNHDQTCLDVTQVYSQSEIPSQINDSNHIIDPILVCSQIEILTNKNQEMHEKLESLINENQKLRELVEKDAETTEFSIHKVDAESSPIKINSNLNEDLCENCKHANDLRAIQEKLLEEVKLLSQELSDVKAQKTEVEQKYDNLTLEMPSVDTLVRKLSALEKECNNKTIEITKLTNTLSNKNKELKQLLDENDTLSTQVMENISEVDDLRKELDTLKEANSNLKEKYAELEQLEKENKSTNTTYCLRCITKKESIHNEQIPESHLKLNRSHSDSDNSSRYSKICTLQNELHASKEDCKKITEDVTTIKNHLERSNLSMTQTMDLDDSMGESNIFTFTKDFNAVPPQMNDLNMPQIPEENTIDMYTQDRIECFNYFAEKIGTEKENVDHGIRIIDIMKMFYNKLIVKHNNEVENHINNLKDFEKLKNELKSQVIDVTSKYEILNRELEDKNNELQNKTKIVAQLNKNINDINEGMTSVIDKDSTDKNSKLVSMFKENVLNVLDVEFNMSSVTIFDALIDIIVNKHQNDLSGIIDQYKKLQDNMESVMVELHTVNDNLKQMKCQLSDKETEYNLLKVQKERIHEISNAVTLDLVKKEQELNETVANGYQKLLEQNIMTPDDMDLTLPLNKNIDMLFEYLIKQFKNQKNIDIEKENLILEVKTSKSIIEEKENQLIELREQNDIIQKRYTDVTEALDEKENIIKKQKSLNEDLNKVHEKIIEANNTNLKLIETLTSEVDILKELNKENETALKVIGNELNQKVNMLAEKGDQMQELMQTVQNLRDENNNLLSLNEIILKEKETYALELEKCNETIKYNKIELDNVTSDILILRESVKENVTLIEKLKLEASSLLEQNTQLKKQYEEKCRDCSRLDLNIKTHEKTVEIQSKMIMRLQKQKEEDNQMLSEKDKRLDELMESIKVLQLECETMKESIKTSKDEMDLCKSKKEDSELQVSQLEVIVENERKPRTSLEVIADNSRRRRQSIHDSKRMFTDDKHDDLNKLEAIFASDSKPDELFVADDNSNRSTPVRLSRGRDSMNRDQCDKEEEPPSRPDSVLAARLRRQSTHDMHRSMLGRTPSPQDNSSNRLRDNSKSSDTKKNHTDHSDVSQLKQLLASCQQELEELKERYKELDEECETCAEYLHERDEQCMRLKKEKTTLEQQVTELKEKLEQSEQAKAKCSVSNASVNTDEDWSNLHAVVVDRMSFDAEVEKNKKLTKALEEFRSKNRDLKATLAKMQKALEKNAARDHSGAVKELEATRVELHSCKKELEELKARYKELDEECETCAEYLREREEQCRRLKEAKTTLEAKLQEVQKDGSVTHTVRKKRQSLHDQNRGSGADHAHSATETSDDFLSYQVERDDSSQRVADHTMQELQRLKMTVERLTQQKAGLEYQLMSASSAPAPAVPVYVATGSAIVQNQQLTDIMKENQKLKKMNTKLINICKKRGKSSNDSNRENNDPSHTG